MMTDVSDMLIDLAKKALCNDKIDVETIMSVAVVMAKAVKVEVDLSEIQKVDLVQTALRGLVSANVDAAVLSKVIDSDLPAIIMKELESKSSLMELFTRMMNMARAAFHARSDCCSEKSIMATPAVVDATLMSVDAYLSNVDDTLSAVDASLAATVATENPEETTVSEEKTKSE